MHGAIKPNGPAVPVNLALPGENVYLTFKGIANRTVTVNIAGTTLAGGYAAIYAPDGAQLAEQGFGATGLSSRTLRSSRTACTPWPFCTTSSSREQRKSA